MSTVFNQALGGVLKNYADVIEGGNTYRGGGTAYKGLPGTYENDPDIVDGTDSPLTVAGVQSLSTTTFDVAAATYSWEESRWVQDTLPALWALCTTSGGTTSIDSEARKITGYNNSTALFTVAPAFSGTPVATDVMTILQGFKRLPNGIDIEADHTDIPGGFDRFFHLFAHHGIETGYSGRGERTYRTELQLRLRISKRGKLHDTAMSAFENIAILAAGIQQGADPDHRDGSFVRALWSEEGPEETADDEHKIVLLQKFILIYRMGSEVK